MKLKATEKEAEAIIASLIEKGLGNPKEFSTSWGGKKEGVKGVKSPLEMSFHRGYTTDPFNINLRINHHLVDKHVRGHVLCYGADSLSFPSWAIGNVGESLKDLFKNFKSSESTIKTILDIFQILEDGWESVVDNYIQDTIELEVENPSWVKVEDLEILSDRLMSEFGCQIYIYNDNHIKNKYVAMYRGQIWDIATGGNNSEDGNLGGWKVQQGDYDYNYFPKMGQNLGHRIQELSLRESLNLSRETVKTYLYKEGIEISNTHFRKWFQKWLGKSSWKPKYWVHHDKIVNDERWSVVANHAKDLLIKTTSDDIHIYSGKHHFIVKKLPWIFYHFAKESLENGKDYSETGVGWAMTW